MQVLVVGPVSDEGTIVVLEGVNEDGSTIHFGVDHRPAQDILNALIEEEEDIYVEIEGWQVVRRIEAPPEETYSIVRYFKDDRPAEVLETGKTLAEAQEHCNRDDTSGADWFDGYRKEES